MSLNIPLFCKKNQSNGTLKKTEMKDETEAHLTQDNFMTGNIKTFMWEKQRESPTYHFTSCNLQRKDFKKRNNTLSNIRACKWVRQFLKTNL